METYLYDKTDPEQSCIQEEQRIMIGNALARLSPDYCQVICLVFFENMSNEETGKIMKKDARQIRNLLYRAKQSLKKELVKNCFGNEELR